MEKSGILKTIPDGMLPIHPHKHQMDTRLPRGNELVKWTRTAPASEPKGISYRLYKNTPCVLKHLWKLMKVVWGNQIVPKDWQRAGEIIIPKEKNSPTISQFRQISLLSMEVKIFLDVVTQRLSIPAEQQLHWYSSEESRDTKLFRMLGTYRHHLAPDPNCQKGKEKSWRSVPEPHKCLWVSELWVPVGSFSTSSRFQRASQGWPKLTTRTTCSA